MKLTANRGDVILVHVPLTIDVLGSGRDTSDGYRFGRVTSVTRDGDAKSVELYGIGGSIDPRGRQSWLIPTGVVDEAALAAWFAERPMQTVLSTFADAFALAERFKRTPTEAPSS